MLNNDDVDRFGQNQYILYMKYFTCFQYMNVFFTIADVFGKCENIEASGRKA